MGNFNLQVIFDFNFNFLLLIFNENFSNSSLFENELDYVDKLLSSDIRNNSAWNQRFFVLERIGFSPEVLQRELHYTMNRIRLIKNNESSWNFLRGVIEFSKSNISQFPDVEQFVEELFTSGNRSPYLLAFLVDMYEEKTLKVYETNSYDDPELYARKVFELCDMLANHYDTIRYKYWKYVQQKFQTSKERAKNAPIIDEQQQHLIDNGST
jgi:protein farnesyltransferase/geranylgeranyltransferase type-1 subunit alpha